METLLRFVHSIFPSDRDAPSSLGINKDSSPSSLGINKDSSPSSLSPPLPAATGDASSPSPPALHFCSSTNEPSDVCNAQWLMLWTTAAYASEIPSMEERQQLTHFYEEFPDQCTEGPAGGCFSFLRSRYPSRTQSRQELMLWLCFAENYCRKQASLPTISCKYSDLMKRWRYSDGYL